MRGKPLHPYKTVASAAAMVLAALFITGCDTAENALNPSTTLAKPAAEEVHIPIARMPERIAIGKTPEKSVIFEMNVLEITPRHEPVTAAEDELLAVLELKITNNDSKSHRIPIAGYTFGGPGFNIPSATLDDQSGLDEVYKIGDGTIQPGQSVSGHLITRIPEKRISKPFLFSLWFDEKEEIFIEMCRQKDDPIDKTKGVQLPPCDADRELSASPVFVEHPKPKKKQ